MGIKPTYIKAMSQELLEKHGEKFTGDFDENKQVVAEVAIIDSKRVRNRIAGSVTRKVNRKRNI